ncbi:MAG: hypothetical protein IJ635_05660 [Bacteroidaceae bacterium]|nr:hypothetical protein [Bacteroidaceae bacterium]
MESFLKYVPIVGDIYKATKIGWDLGTFLDEYLSENNHMLQKAMEHLQTATDSDNAELAKKEALKSIKLLNNSKRDKKYQDAYMYLLRGFSHYLIALCNISLSNSNVYNEFYASIRDLKILCHFELTFLTEKKDEIRELQADAMELILEIEEKKEIWLKHDKIEHPQTYGMSWKIYWFFKSLFDRLIDTQKT